MTLEAGASPRRRPSDAFVAVTLALLLGLQPVTTDLYLPGLPALSAEFGGAVGRAQLTLSALILAFGLGQLLMGPMSDRFGRRPVLLGGLALHVLGSVGSAHAMSMELLIAGRVLQGVGLAAAVVCGRAMVRDLYEPLRGTLVMSRGQSGLGLLALGSPLLGGVLAGTLGWRWWSGGCPRPCSSATRARCRLPAWPAPGAGCCATPRSWRGRCS